MPSQDISGALNQVSAGAVGAVTAQLGATSAGFAVQTALGNLSANVTTPLSGLFKGLDQLGEAFADSAAAGGKPGAVALGNGATVSSQYIDSTHAIAK